MTIAQKLMGSGNNWLASQNICGSVNSAEAAAGSNQAGATTLTLDDIHWVKPGGSNAGVIFPTSMGPGDSMWIFANTGNTMKVYPPGTGQINQAGASTAISLTDKQKAYCVCLDGGANANFLAVVS